MHVLLRGVSGSLDTSLNIRTTGVAPPFLLQLKKGSPLAFLLLAQAVTALSWAFKTSPTGRSGLSGNSLFPLFSSEML